MELLLAQNNNNHTNMELENQQQGSQCSPTKIERRIIEKNRRNQMKILYSKLNSLLPKHTSKEPLTVPDQIDEAINYIKSLETKMKNSEVKKESLLVGTKRSQRSLNLESTRTQKSPQIAIHEMGSVLEVVLVSGSDNQFVFYEVLRIIHEEGADVISAKFSVSGDTIYNVINAELGESMFIFGAAKITEKLKRFVSGSSSDVELQPELWDLESWDF